MKQKNNDFVKTWLACVVFSANICLNFDAVFRDATLQTGRISRRVIIDLEQKHHEM